MAAAAKRLPEAEKVAKARWLERRAERRGGEAAALPATSLREAPARDLAKELGKRPFRAAAGLGAAGLRRAGGWWEENRTVVAVAAVSAFFGFAMWSAYTNAQAKNAAALTDHKTGWWPHHHDFGGWGGGGGLDGWGSQPALMPGAFHAPADPYAWNPYGAYGALPGGYAWE